MVCGVEGSVRPGQNFRVHLMPGIGQPGIQSLAANDREHSRIAYLGHAVCSDDDCGRDWAGVAAFHIAIWAG